MACTFIINNLKLPFITGSWADSDGYRGVALISKSHAKDRKHKTSSKVYVQELTLAGWYLRSGTL